MKKIFYTCLFYCLIWIVETKAQSLMTVAEVYDYNVGDIFVTRWGGYYAAPSHVRTTITNKYYNLTADTIFYHFDQLTYQPCYPLPCAGYTSSTFNNIISYTNLNDTLGNDLGTEPTFPCIDTNGYTGTWMDTTFYNPFYCNILTTQISYIVGPPLLTDSCWGYFEAEWGNYSYGKGLGDISYYNNQCAFGVSNCEAGKYLVYYKKGNDSCGTMPQMADIPVGLAEHEILAVINVFPNPINTQSTVSFHHEQKNTTIKIINIQGNLVKTLNFTGKYLDIKKDELPAGTYILEAIDEQHNYSHTKLIIQ